MSAIRGVRKAFVISVTTPPNAAPITTPTAISTTLPRRMNFLNPSSISTSEQDWGQMYDRQGGRSSGTSALSDRELRLVLYCLAGLDLNFPVRTVVCKMPFAQDIASNEA